MPAPERVEYMAVPRMVALAEVVWSKPERRSWADFRRRLTAHQERLDALRVNYSRGSFKVAIGTELDSSRSPFIVMSSEQDSPVIRYTLDGSGPTRFSPVYEEPLPLSAPATVKAAIFEGAAMKEEPAAQSIILHKGMRGRVTLTRPAPEYPAAPTALIDGITGSIDPGDGTWTGFSGTDVTVVIALESEQTVRRVVLTVLSRPRDRIRPPAEVLFESSADGNEYMRMDRTDQTVAQTGEGASVIQFVSVAPVPLRARFVRVTARNPGPVPDGEPGAGRDSVLLADEVIVE
jgi:hexosaminidase